MQGSKWSSNFLTVVAFLSASLAGAAGAQEPATDSRCVATLNRVESNFCIGDSHASADASLNFTWRVNDQKFQVIAPACLTTRDRTGERKDMVIAIDRSYAMARFEARQKKEGIEALSLAKALVERLRDEYEGNKSKAPKVALMLFAGTRECRAYTGGALDVGGEFPCLYIAGDSIAEESHVSKLLELLGAASGKSSKLDVAKASDYSIVTDAMRSDWLNLPLTNTSSLLLFSDGRSYQAENASSLYPYLRGKAYSAGQSLGRDGFTAISGRGTTMIFAMPKTSELVFDSDMYGDSYANLCDLADRDADDCSASVKSSEAATWPANKVDVRAYARSLVQILAGSEFVEVSEASLLDTAVDKQRIDKVYPSNVEGFTYTIDGGTAVQGLKRDKNLVFPDLPADRELAMAFTIKADGVERQLAAKFKTVLEPYNGDQLEDKEMLCQGGGIAPQEPGKLKLQGGSASCGVIKVSSGPRSASWWLMLLALFLPLLHPLMRLKGRSQPLAGLAAGIVAASLLAPGKASAAEPAGANFLNFQPAAGGIATVESAEIAGPLEVNAGLFVDYANDPIELAGPKSRRVSSLQDDVLTGHAALTLGLFRPVAVGAYLPYVQKSDLDRQGDRPARKGGELGQPGDGLVFAKIGLIARPTWYLSLMPMATTSTGNPDLLLGEQKSRYGLKGLVSVIDTDWRFALGLGFLQRHKALVFGDSRSESLVLRTQGLAQSGIEYRISQSWGLGTAVDAKMNAGAPIGSDAASPIEWRAQLAYLKVPAWRLESGFGSGIGRGLGAPDYRIYMGLSFLGGSDSVSPKATAAEGRKGINTKPAPAKSKRSPTSPRR